MSINLSGSLILTGSLTVTGGITMSGSIASASYALSSSYAANADLLDNRDSLTFANTGSNTFSGGQYVSSSFNPTGFSTTASLYTDGGLRVTKDAYISGTLYLNNVTVYGTQSVAYITSSQLNIASNLITVNTATPSVQFGGLAVYDSGSTGLTGSILWDSTNNRWIYSNPSGSSYDGGMFISGPRNSSGLGSETGTTACMLLAGQGGDHLTSSMIYHSSTVTCIPNAIVGVNSINVSTICTSNGIIGSNSNNLYLSSNSAAGEISFWGNQLNTRLMTITGGGCVGIGISSPSSNLHVYSIGETKLTISTGNPSANSNVVLEMNGNYYYDGIIRNNSNGSLVLQTGGTNDRIRIDVNGMVGIGVTPNAWYTGNSSKAIQLGVAGVGLWGYGSTNNINTYLLNNAYYDSVGFKYAQASGKASAYQQTNGEHVWVNTNTTGTSAGDVLTLCERMRITSTGIACFACQICTPAIYPAFIYACTTTALNSSLTNTAVTIEQRYADVTGGGDYQGGGLLFMQNNSGGATWAGGAITSTVGTTACTGGYPGGLAFWVKSASGGTGTSGIAQAMRIDWSGRVGIGTTTPSQKLEVVGGEIKAGRVDSSQEGGQVSFGRASDNATGWYLDVYGSTSTPSLRLVDVSNSSVRMTVDGSGITCFQGTVCAPTLARCASKWTLTGSIEGGNNACALVLDTNGARAVRVRGVVGGISGQTMTSMGMYEAILYRIGSSGGNESKRFAVFVDCNASPGNGQGIQMNVVNDNLYIQNKTGMSYAQTIQVWAEVFYG